MLGQIGLARAGLGGRDDTLTGDGLERLLNCQGQTGEEVHELILLLYLWDQAKINVINLHLTTKLQSENSDSRLKSVKRLATSAAM